MSLTFQQIILDAKKLVIRISDHENTADTLISQVEAVCGQIDNMKQVNIAHVIYNVIIIIVIIIIIIIYLYIYMIIFSFVVSRGNRNLKYRSKAKTTFAINCWDSKRE